MAGDSSSLYKSNSSAPESFSSNASFFSNWYSEILSVFSYSKLHSMVHKLCICPQG